MKNNSHLLEKKPQHIGFILDGNRRWAKKHKYSKEKGHQAGVEAIKRTVDASLKYKIPCISMFAFSTENWKRDKDEINTIFKLIDKYFKEEEENLIKKGIKVQILGETSKFSKKMQINFKDILEKTKNNDKMILNILLNYGGRADIVRAVNKLIDSGKKDISEKDISDNLYTAGMPDLDLVIRTSGEQRISNFMIYQLAYAELYFPKTYWPDFNEKKLKKAIKVYSKRERRYGGL